MASSELIEVLDYVTKDGDTFDTLALELYAEERLASVIMDYNRDFIDVLVFDAGVHLNLPVFTDVETADSLPPWRR